MLNRICYCILFFSVCTSPVFGQQYLFGRIFKKNSQEVIPGVGVHNYSSGKYNTSDLGGNYRIAAAVSDTLVFSSAGYHTDTFYLTASPSAASYTIFLTPNIVALPTVEIDEMSKYRADSLERRRDYAFILDKKHPVTLINKKRAGDAPGLNFSPVGFFSKGERRKRALKQRVIKEDEEEYIDARFPRTRVAFLTRLSGDSLQQFMLRYRPSYQFCRATDNQKMFLYINDSAVKFRAVEKRKRPR
ncbi:MAG: carboxypeptidase-like regulatory domain-containing protein [Chitinophagaceae bacterium]